MNIDEPIEYARELIAANQQALQQGRGAFESRGGMDRTMTDNAPICHVSIRPRGSSLSVLQKVGSGGPLRAL
jgi:hypothetical protein